MNFKIIALFLIRVHFSFTFLSFNFFLVFKKLTCPRKELGVVSQSVGIKTFTFYLYFFTLITLYRSAFFCYLQKDKLILKSKITKVPIIEIYIVM